MLDGLLGLRVGDKELVASPGDVAVVAPGTPHRFWNAGEDEARFLCEVRPALQFESLIETMFTLAAEGKTNRKGMPNPLQLAVIAKAHFDTVRLPFPPPRPAARGARSRSAARQGARLPGDDDPAAATRRRHASALAWWLLLLCPIAAAAFAVLAAAAARRFAPVPVVDALRYE